MSSSTETFQLFSIRYSDWPNGGYHILYNKIPLSPILCFFKISCVFFFWGGGGGMCVCVCVVGGGVLLDTVCEQLKKLLLILVHFPFLERLFTLDDYKEELKH